MPSLLVHADPAARPPEHWSAASFYRRYAFHGPSFQGLAEVVSIGPNSGEAIVHVTDLPGIDHQALLLDPALLDCAGQLVAFWLLEQGERTPAFGIFPVSARRCVQHLPPPPPGTRLRCRCRVTLEPGGLTNADVLFLTADNRVVATIEGFVQRLIEFPPALAVALFGGAAVDFSQPLPTAPGQVARQLDIQLWALLQDGQGIWARLLAQQILGSQERRSWRTLAPAAAASATDWLLGRLVAKEAVAAWAARYAGQTLHLAEIGFALLPVGNGGEFAVDCAGLTQPLHLHLTAEQQTLTAVVRTAPAPSTKFTLLRDSER